MRDCVSHQRVSRLTDKKIRRMRRRIDNFVKKRAML